MGYLLTIVHPKIGVFLNALPAHTEQMRSVENIFKEKSKLISSLPADGTAVINSDYNIETKAKIVKFKDDATPVPPAIAVGKIFGIPPKTSHQLLATSHYLPPGRGSIFEGINGSKIIDSSYNASPIPMLNALDQLKKHPGQRKVAVLGDMRELGDLAPQYHREIAQKAYESADAVITVGPLCRQFFPKNPKLVAQFDNSYKAGKFLQTFVKKGDVVLFKGSQNTIFLETAVKMCLAHPADSFHLCRRGKFWDKQREKYKKTSQA